MFIANCVELGLTPPAGPSQRLVPLVPDGDPVTGADLLLVLAEVGGPGDDATGEAGAAVSVREAGDGGAEPEVVTIGGDHQAPAYHLVDLHQPVQQPEPRPPVLVGGDVAEVAVVPVQGRVLRRAVPGAPGVVVRPQTGAALARVACLVYGEAVRAGTETVHSALYHTAGHELCQSDHSFGSRREVVPLHPQHGHGRPQDPHHAPGTHQHRHLPSPLYRLPHLVRGPLRHHHHLLPSHVNTVVVYPSSRESSGHCLQQGRGVLGLV